MSEKILIIDDEKEIADLMELYLTNENYEIFKFYSALEALDSIASTEFDLAVLDIMLPDINGFTLCQKIREKYNYPIIMLTAKNEETDKITGLTLGADDYITKPFKPLELVARIKAQLRRYKKYNITVSSGDDEVVITHSSLMMNVKTHECFLNEKPLALTPTEFSILQILLENKGSAVSSEELFHRIWKDEYYSKSNNTITVHIRHLREKMDGAPIKKPYGEWGIKLKNKDKSEYANLKSKIYSRFFILTAAAIAIVFVLYKLLWKNRGWDFTLRVLLRLSMDRDTAENIYQHYFRNFTEIIWIIAVAVIFLVMLRFFLNWFTKYFTSINQGIDELLEEDDNKILLPPEMSATENTLNTVKRALRQRKKVADEAEQRKNDLITYLAHDIHTPLTSVIGYISLLKESPNMPRDKAEAYLDITLDKSLQLEKLINEFFEITKYNLQEISLNKQDTDIYYMLLQLTDEFYPVLKQHGNSIKLNADENLSGRVDAEKLARVFSNILRNAVSYSYPDTVIAIDAVRDNGNIVISVNSRGKTIPKEKLRSVFEKFFRADESRPTGTGGAGLGLAIAKEIVTLHGGEITAESEDEITMFTVHIPAL